MKEQTAISIEMVVYHMIAKRRMLINKRDDLDREIDQLTSHIRILKSAVAEGREENEKH